MNSEKHLLAEQFFAAIAQGELPDSLVTEDMTAWTLTSGDTAKSKFAGGVKALSAVFGGTLTYVIDEVTEQDDRLVAEVHSQGTLINGEAFSNLHVFIFHFRDTRIARVAEYMNPIIVQQKLLPVMQQLMSKSGQ